MPEPIALQLYSVKNEAQRDLAGTLRRIHEMGYDGVELFGFDRLDRDTIKAVMDETGLKICGSHTLIEAWADDRFADTVAYHHALDCDKLICPWLPEDCRDSVPAATRTAHVFSGVQRKLADVGMVAGFHCHAQDVAPLADDPKTTAWQVIGEHTPDAFILEYDTANGMDGGDDPVAPIRQFPGRSVLLHLKEYHRDGGHGQGAIGEGDVPFVDVIAAAREVGGTTWFVVEQEGHPSLDEMAAAERCIQNLRPLLDQEHR